MTYSKTGLSILTAMMLTLAGCGGSSSSNGSTSDGSSDNEDTSLLNHAVLDATDSDSAVYLDLDSGHTVTTTESWQMAYEKYVGFSTNADGGIEACVAKEYEALYDDNGEPVKSEFEALTINNTEEDFNNVTLTACSDFIADGVTSQFTDWYTYDFTTHVITVNSDETNGWIVRSSTDDGNGNASYTRLKATAYNANGITFNSELWDSNSETFSAAESTGALSAASGTTYWNMETNTHSTTEFEGWDLKIEADGHSTIILINGGVSGTGDAGVAGHSALQVASVDDVTDPTDTAQVYKYFGDSASGAMSGSSEFNYGALQYNVGGLHKMWPTFNVYLFKDGERYFKAQVISNYGADGTSRSGTLYVRHQELF